MGVYGEPVSRLIGEFSKLPGIGGKTAQRLAFFVLEQPKEKAYAFAEAIKDAVEQTVFCTICQNLSDSEVCEVCADQKRDITKIMVVEDPRDMAAYERTKRYRGLYHVLHGAINPLSNVAPADLRLKELLERLRGDEVAEVILATNPNVEGEATAMYIARLIKPLGVKVSRIAHGVPVGGDLELADSVTLTRAYEGRVLMVG